MADTSFSLYFLDCVSSDLPPGGLLPLHHEAAVEPVNSHQLIMGALLDDLTVIDNEYFVGMAHGFQPMGNHDDRLIVSQFRNSLHQLLFIFGVNIGSGFVQNDDRRVFIIARAMEMRWRSPPESELPASPMTVSKPSGSAMIKS